MPRKKFIKKDMEYVKMMRIEEEMSKLKEIPDKVDVSLFDISFETNHLQNIRGEKNVIFLILFNNDLEMVKRTINKLKFNNQHHFIINICPDIKEDIKKELIETFKEDLNVSLSYCGYIRYLSSTDIKIIFSFKNYLLNFDNWHFLITLGQNDYPLYYGEDFNKKIGDKTWCYVEGSKDKSVINKEIKKTGAARYTVGLVPTNKKIHKFDRSLWIFNIFPDILMASSRPLSSGGIFNRDAIKILVKDNQCRIIYNYCLLLCGAGVEHYWAICFSLPQFKNMIKKTRSCIMSWLEGRQGQMPGISNTYLTINQLDLIKNAYKEGSVFARKFDSQKEKDILTTIDQLSSPSSPERIF